MARSRQKAKQRKAQRLAQEQKQAERARKADGGDQPAEAPASEDTAADASAADQAEQPDQPRESEVEERLEEIEEEHLGRESMEGTGIAAEVAVDQARMDAELEQAAEPEEGEGQPSQPHVQESKRAQRQREKAARRAREASQKAAKQKRREPAADKPAKRERGKPAKQQGKAAKPPRERGRVINFFAQVWAELKRVQWPTRDQVFQATGVVVGFCFVAGLYLAFFDFVWNKVVDILY